MFFPHSPYNFPFKDLKRTFKDLKHTFKDLKHTFKVFERKIARGSGKFSPGKAEKKALTEFNYCKQSIKAGPGMQEKAYLCGRKPKTTWNLKTNLCTQQRKHSWQPC